MRVVQADVRRYIKSMDAVAQAKHVELWRERADAVKEARSAISVKVRLLPACRLHLRLLPTSVRGIRVLDLWGNPRLSTLLVATAPLLLPLLCVAPLCFA